LDISVDMLEQAKKKIQVFGWKNVDVYEQNAMEFDYKNTKGVISTLAFTLIPEYEELIAKISRELPKNKKFVHGFKTFKKITFLDDKIISIIC